MLDDFLSEADLPAQGQDVRPHRVVARPPAVSPQWNPAIQEIHHPEPPRLALAPRARRRPDGRLIAAAVLGLMFGSIAALRLSNLGAADLFTQTQAPASAALEDSQARVESPAPVVPRPETAERPAAVEASPPAGVTSSPVLPSAASDVDSKPTASAGTSEPRAATQTVEPSLPKRVEPPAPVVLEPLRDAAPAAVVTELASPPADVSPLAPAPAEPQPIPAPVKTEARAESASPLAPPVAPAAPPSVDERPAIDSVINRYRSAYSELDAGAVKHVWPTASEAALARAFANLDSQNLAFYQCETAVAGATATARCDGQVSYVGRVGPRQPRTQNREWTFTLKKAAGGWVIERVQIR